MPIHKSLIVLIALYFLASNLVCAESGESFIAGPYLSWEGEDARGIRVRSDLEQVKARIYEDSDEISDKARILEMKKEDSTNLWTVKVDGLSPGKAYSYAIESSDHKPSQRYKFIMPPKAGDSKNFRVLFYGDTQSQPDVHSQIADAMSKEAPFTAILHLGDLIDDGNDSELWIKEFFAPAKNLLPLAPLLPCIGNHENRSPLFFNYFPIAKQSGKEGYYSLDIGNMHVLFIDQFQEFGAGSEQRRWIEEDLSKVPRDRWKLVIFHEPAFTTIYGASVKDATDDLPQIFDSLGVDLVLNGHIHEYIRFRPVLGKSGKAVTYLTCGSAGGRRHRAVKSSATAACVNEHCYGVIDASGDKLEITAKLASGEIIDSFSILRGKNPKNSIPLAEIMGEKIFMKDVQDLMGEWLTIEGVPESGKEKILTAKLPAPSTPIELSLSWDCDGTSWAISPVETSIQVPAGLSPTISWNYCLNSAVPFPTPKIYIGTPAIKLPPKALLISGGSRDCNAFATDETIVLDGCASEIFWQKAESIGNLVRDDGHGFCENKSLARVVAGKSGLFIHFHCEENNMEKAVARANKKDTPAVWLDDSVEVFVEPTKYSGDYKQFVVSLSGQKFDAALRDYLWDGDWDLKVRRGDKFWEAELFIPWSDLGLSGTPGKGTKMGFNICRTENNADSKGRTAYQQWSPTMGDSHNSRGFGTLTVK